MQLIFTGDSGGSKKHALDGGPDPPWEWAIFGGKAVAHCKL